MLYKITEKKTELIFDRYGMSVGTARYVTTHLRTFIYWRLISVITFDLRIIAIYANNSCN